MLDGGIGLRGLDGGGVGEGVGLGVGMREEVGREGEFGWCRVGSRDADS